MTSTPEVSIIVPVYKVEKYIRRCLDSIIAQTFTDWECILVDDGSPDASGRICDGYAAKDSRFRVIHKKNGGVSSARNAGLDVARGEYVTFCDSDDWVEKNWLSEQLNDISTGNFDVCVCGLYGYGRARRKILNRKSSKQLIFSENGFGGFSFLRFIKRRNVGDLRYNESISYLEDLDFFYRLFDKCNKILWTDKPLYHYDLNPSSVTNQNGFSKQAFTGLDFLAKLEKTETNKILAKTVKISRLNMLASLIISESISRKERSDMSNKALLELKKNLIMLIFSKKMRLKRKILISLMCFSKNFNENFIFLQWKKHRFSC